MKYFNYQIDKPMSKVWSLFRDLEGMSNEQLDKLYSESDYSHTLDIVKSALNGSISLTDDAIKSFNLQAYEYKCKENDKNGRFNRASEVLNIVQFDNSDEDEKKTGYGDISDRKLRIIDDSFDEVMNSVEFESSIRELLGVRKKYIIEHGIDLVSVLMGSLKGIPESIQALKECIKIDDKIKDLIASLCENSKGKLLLILEAST